MLGAAYEYLLRQFADESGRKAGEFFTPREVVHLLVGLLRPTENETVYDPACGSGGMLVETSNAVKAGGGDTRTLRLYGQEINLTTSAIARMNLFLHDLEDFRIIREDTLREPRHLTAEGTLQTFDVVIANPPFSLKNWGAETWVGDPFGRSFCGVPPSNSADLAWVQHMIASMDGEKGRVGVVMPHGVLFRAGAEQRIRQCLLESDLLDAVIGLPANLFYSTTIPACILIFRAKKEKVRANNILFVDGSLRFAKGRNQNSMSTRDVSDILDAAARPSDQTDGVGVRLVPIDEVRANGWDLSISRYIARLNAAELDIEGALTRYRAAESALALAQEQLSLRLAEAGYE